MRIVDIRETAIALKSTLRNAVFDFSEMTTSVVAVITDVIGDGKPVASIGRINATPLHIKAESQYQKPIGNTRLPGHHQFTTLIFSAETVLFQFFQAPGIQQAAIHRATCSTGCHDFLLRLLRNPHATQTNPHRARPALQAAIPAVVAILPWPVSAAGSCR